MAAKGHAVLAAHAERPPANSTLIADLRRGEHIVSDLPEVNIGELSAISAVIAVCCA
jgi:hypothetical protein